MAEAPLPAALLDLLDSLESQSPTLSALPAPDAAGSWGSYFDCLDAGEHEALGESRRQLRLRIMSAIGNCRSLRSIHLNPWRKLGKYSVRAVEATALLKGLKHNPALESLSLDGFKGFGSTEACIALADAVLPPGCRLQYLDMRATGLSVEGLAHISAALRDNSSGSLLRKLELDCNDMIGNAAGARHIAAILTHSPALRTLGLCRIGMDHEGAMLIADAVARTTTLDRLDIGYDRQEHPEQAAMMIPILRALGRGTGVGVPSSSLAELQSHTLTCASPSRNQSITKLWLEVDGLPGGKDSSPVDGRLAEALAGMLHSNTTLKLLYVTSYFVTRSLSALALNSSITHLVLVHPHSLDEKELDPMLMPILHKCMNLRVLILRFIKPYGASNFTKELFQGLKHNKPCIKTLVLDGWDGLDDHMFQDLIHSLSTNTNLEKISIKGTSWERQGKSEQLAKTFRDTRMGPQLLALLAELESDSPELQQLPAVHLWGSYFDCECQDEECFRREWQWDVRLRLLTAIGQCRTLRKIELSPAHKAGYSVRQVEALALLSGLQHNLVLQELNLLGYLGFGTIAACVQALTAVIESCHCSLQFLGLQGVGLSAQGLGYIAAALRRNGTSVLSNLLLCGNHIGNAVGAQHLADILTNSPTLRALGISNIGMDKEGAVVIAEALAHTTTLTSLGIGYAYNSSRNVKQPAPMFIIPLLEALVWHTADQETPQARASNHSITRLVLERRGGQQAVEPGLGEALARVLRTNRSLKDLELPSFFVTRGLGALRESTSITKLRVFHRRNAEDDDMDPVLITILEECKSVQELRLHFEKPFGPSRFTKAFFEGLHNNPSIKTLVLDAWDGLDDYMFHDLMRSLRPNCITSSRTSLSRGHPGKVKAKRYISRMLSQETNAEEALDGRVVKKCHGHHR